MTLVTGACSPRGPDSGRYREGGCGEGKTILGITGMHVETVRPPIIPAWLQIYCVHILKMFSLSPSYVVRVSNLNTWRACVGGNF